MSEEVMSDASQARPAQPHTPGPWFIPAPSMGFSEIRAAGGELVFGLAAGSEAECQDVPTIEANARLIAAAPDLLASMKEVSDMLMARPDITAKLHPLFGFAEKAIFERAAAAIAKAEGRS